MEKIVFHKTGPWCQGAINKSRQNPKNVQITHRNGRKQKQRNKTQQKQRENNEMAGKP